MLVSRFQRRLASSTLKHTPFYDKHIALKGKMVPFAGYSLPVLYESLGVLKEHTHTRTKASLFDVSHMGQITFTGKDKELFLEKMMVAGVFFSVVRCGF